MIPLVDLQRQRERIADSLRARMDAVLAHGQFIMGPEVLELEQALADYAGARHCIGVSNGTDALVMAMMALGVGPGTVVVTTPFTFYATAESALLLGAEVAFADIDENNWNLDPAALEALLTQLAGDGQKVSAVVGVDIFGLPADWEALESICGRFQIPLIEDAAQSFGGAIGARRCGSFGDIATTSFFPSKPLGCYGDGGAIFTDSDEHAATLRSIRVHGKGDHKYDNVRVGLNARLDTLQAAVLLEKLPLLDGERSVKERVARHYAQALPAEVTVQTVRAGATSGWANMVLRVPDRDRMLAALQEHGVGSAVYYDRTLGAQSVFSDRTDGQQPVPIATQLCEQAVTIPLNAYLTEAEIEQVIGAVQAGIQ